MTDEELIAWVRNGFGNVAADRIEALVKESAEMEAEAHAHIELWGKALREKAAAEARAERLEAALREIAETFDGKSVAAIARAALKGAAEPTEYERKVAQMKKDFPNGI